MLKSVFFLGTLVLFFFMGNLYATNYFVSTSSSGNSSGNSWTNKQIYSSFNWTKLAGGDSVYFDGGTDSLVYGKVTISSVVPNSNVIITKGKDTGHNGKAVIIQIIVNSCKYIKLTGLTFETTTANPYTDQQVVYFENGSQNTIDNCRVISDGTNVVLNLATETQDIMTNCDLESLTNSLSNNQDIVDIRGGGGGHIFTGNTVIARGSNTTPHTDLMQWGANEGQNNNYQTTIANNFFAYIAPSAVGNGVGVYLGSTGSNRFLIYNNVVVINMAVPMSCLAITPDVDTYSMSARVFNNTFINGTANGVCARFDYMDTLIFKNNICVETNSSGNSVFYVKNKGLGYITYKDIDYNQYYLGGRSLTIDTSGSGSISWANWQLKYDQHGTNGNASFTNLWGSTVTDYTLTTGASTGANLSSYFTTDIVGTARSAWDKGAYEKSGILPVELASFTGVISHNVVHLAWQTATETNNQGFEIDRNTSSTWSKIGFVAGKGNSNTITNYSFDDKNPVGSTIQYRLKQIDINGNFIYSNTVTLTGVVHKLAIGNYPNPFNPATKINYTLPTESMINLVIYNAIGERVEILKNEVQQSGSYELNWNGSGHPSGIYFLSIMLSPVDGSAKDVQVIKMNLLK